MEHDPYGNSGNPQWSDTSGDDTPTVEAPQVSDDGSSRRNFLKAAVVASAAVAAAGGAAGVALINSKAPTPLIRFIGSVISYPPTDPCAICTTGTTAPYAPESSFNGELMIWLRFLSVPNGTYSVDINNSGGATCSTSSPVFPFKYNGDPVTAWTHSAGSLACNPVNDPASPDFTGLNLNGTSSNKASSLPVTFTITGGPLDVLLKVHLHTCSQAGTFTLVTTLTDITDPTHGTVVDHCQNDVTTHPDE
jgi:hypothetical protein